MISKQHWNQHHEIAQIHLEIVPARKWLKYVRSRQYLDVGLAVNPYLQGVGDAKDGKVTTHSNTWLEIPPLPTDLQ